MTSPTTNQSPVLPSGTQHTLRHGDQVAVIAAVGASLREYRVGDRDVVLPFDQHQIAPAFSGAVLAPWPNRLANGAYGYRGAAYQVAITEADRQTALHGLVAYVPFALGSHDEASLTLTTTIVPIPGYPWPLRLDVTYTLSDEGLEVRTVATNLGTSDAPYGLGFHPWLSPGAAAVDECTLQLGAQRHVVVDARLLPTGDEALVGKYDLREPTLLAGIALDDAWLAPTRDEAGLTWARLASPDGHTVALWADETFPAWQVCTGNGIEGIERRGVAVEPMTCIADAFRTGDLLVELAPGASHDSRWGLRLE
ncbi:aldose 1-epimerase family protein [Cellulomonas sp. DKR-3]|uniref:Aldose 1-epimerase family protein n=1 Tax=Cellulomonas fulva TaxID=2835530 RepID=A0ABS5U232_9CELL|nr:aldose 1-epimerase family protein [Cellulomonas fulva]MBT0995445.1 aldose 1-epimerase family protein [Cellulomonas fulva]